MRMRETSIYQNPTPLHIFSSLFDLPEKVRNGISRFCPFLGGESPVALSVTLLSGVVSVVQPNADLLYRISLKLGSSFLEVGLFLHIRNQRRRVLTTDTALMWLLD